MNTLLNTTSGVPILLVTKMPTDRLIHDDRFMIVATADHTEVILKRGDMGVDVEVAVVDTATVDRQEGVLAALFLRNAGLTAIVGDVTRVPTDIVQDIHNFAVKVKSNGEPVRTEALLMEDAMELYGDITDVVKYFEGNLL